MIQSILKILSVERFSTQNEKETQSQIEDVLKRNNIDFKREHRLSPESIPDFFIDGIAIEVKIKGNAMQIYKQCERYSKFDEVKQLILITNRSMGFPAELNNKPCYVMKLGNSWL